MNRPAAVIWMFWHTVVVVRETDEIHDPIYLEEAA